MVVLVGMGNAKVQAHLVQEIRLGQRNAPGLEVTRHIKRQPVRTRTQGEQATLVKSLVLNHDGRTAMPAAGQPCMVSKTWVLRPIGISVSPRGGWQASKVVQRPPCADGKVYTVSVHPQPVLKPVSCHGPLRPTPRQSPADGLHLCHPFFKEANP